MIRTFGRSEESNSPWYQTVGNRSRSNSIGFLNRVTASFNEFQSVGVKASLWPARTLVCDSVVMKEVSLAPNRALSSSAIAQFHQTSCWEAGLTSCMNRRDEPIGGIKTASSRVNP